MLRPSLLVASLLAVSTVAAPLPFFEAAFSTTGIDGGRLGAALGATGSRLVWEHGEVPFVVVETRALGALERALGRSAELDARGAGGAVPNDPSWPAQWGPQAIGMPAAWDLEDGSDLVIVAIVDSGLDAAHPDFAGVPILPGFDWVDGDLDTTDLNGHGTHVAGIVAAARDDGVGVAGMVRVALLPIRVLDAANAGNCLDFALGIVDATDRGARVINLSLYCSVNYAPLFAAVKYASAAGVVVVGVTGNFQSSAPAKCVTWPGKYPEVLATAAVDSSLAAASFSCRGPETDLAAPGVGILSTLPGGYGSWSGTSMAAPHVSGAAALLLARDPLLTSADVRNALQSTALDLGATGPDGTYGAGLLRADLALLSV